MPEQYESIRAEIVDLLKSASSAAARNVNSIMTAVYWEIGGESLNQNCWDGGELITVKG